MHQTDLFKTALGLRDPWQVVDVDFDEKAGRLDIKIDFPKGSRFLCPECAETGCPVHDTEDKTWRHLDFFQHEAYLHARVPRVECNHHGVHQVDVPWARPGSGFTLLFEALLVQFATAMPVATVAKMVREHDTRIWRVLEHYVGLLRENEDYSDVVRVGADETSARRGHDYVSIFMDLDKAGVLFATDGKDASTVERFAEDFENHDGVVTRITEASIDMSPAFISGIEQFLPCAEITFDRFHVMKKLSEAVDEVRRTEQKDNPILKRSRYVWLKNSENLTARQQETLARFDAPIDAPCHDTRIPLARGLPGVLRTVRPRDGRGVSPLVVLRRGKRSRLQPVKDFVALVESHWDGIVSWHHTRIANGLLEGTNSLIQTAKARARGYRSKQKMITIIYLIAGKLPLPTLSTPLCVPHTI